MYKERREGEREKESMWMYIAKSRRDMKGVRNEREEGESEKGERGREREGGRERTSGVFAFDRR